jgi:hypothetical protein
MTTDRPPNQENIPEIPYEAMAVLVDLILESLKGLPIYAGLAVTTRVVGILISHVEPEHQKDSIAVTLKAVQAEADQWIAARAFEAMEVEGHA